MLRPFRYRQSRELLKTPIFRLREDEAEHPRTGRVRPYVALDAPDWVNIVAITDDEQMLLVRQWRHGTRRFELELPAGALEPGESPEQAAARELMEETGYQATSITLIGTVAPNAAYQSNRCFTVLAEGCRKTGETNFDEGEDIEIELCAPEALRARLGGEVQNALVFCGLYWWLERRGRVQWP